MREGQYVRSFASNQIGVIESMTKHGDAAVVRFGIADKRAFVKTHSVRDLEVIPNPLSPEEVNTREVQAHKDKKWGQ